MKNRFIFKTFLLCVVCCFSSVEAKYLFKNGHFINTKDLATKTIEEHFSDGKNALEQKKFEEALKQFEIITINFPHASLSIDATYYMGVCLYELKDFALANESFTQYINKNNSLDHFEDVYRYKLAIADQCAEGHKRHLFNAPSLPRIMSTDDLALDLYNEVAAALPSHALAAQALLSKAAFLTKQDQFSLAALTYQSAIARFPESTYALSSYLGIASCYLQELQLQPQNVDLITLAEINAMDCLRLFPQATENTKIADSLAQMKNMYSTALFNMAAFYERKNLPKSSVLYYHLAATTYPECTIAPNAKERLKALSKYAEELHLPKNSG